MAEQFFVQYDTAQCSVYFLDSFRVLLYSASSIENVFGADFFGN